MHKTKKKSKTAKLPKPIKVKKEKADEDRLPQPMTHYLDDRLEMVKQIFNTLKPKTIVNLAPDFLKIQTLEEIEEACLNELLCISTKRLKSIITATKCPTDTESSDNDSDVERQEEHISLEEISSDSEIEGSSSKKAKKKKTSKVAEESDADKKNTPNADEPGDGQISVLELLELQARARAIRSQLALEPVTKIEVDSDEEKRKEKDKEKGKASKRDDKTNKNERKRVSSERESRDSVKLSRMNGSTESLNSKVHTEKEVEKNTSKKIKLKRNYRNATNKDVEDYNQEKQFSETNKEGKEKNNTVKLKEKHKEQGKTNTMETIISDIKKEKCSRSPSPDVIPIIAEPETLLITDSSDDEKKKGNKGESLKGTCEKPINEQTIRRERKSIEKESRDVDKNIEISSTQKTNKSQNLPESTLDNSAESSVCIDKFPENTENSELKISDKNDTHDNNTKNKDVKLSNKEKSKSNDGTNSTNHSDDDQNDDVISLGGDLENEMNEQLENEVNVLQSSCNKKPTEDNKSEDDSQAEDVISLESSEDEQQNDNQSWHTRYMKSSKVSKVLAASRLGKRVRDKIKKSKHSKKENPQEKSNVEKETSTPAFTSKHEDGSVEQYKELLEMRQRKSS